MPSIEVRIVPCHGGPLDGQKRRVIAPTLIVPATPILKTHWTGENYEYEFTEHRYHLRNGAYEYRGTRQEQMA